jgi:hypothetical protein
MFSWESKKKECQRKGKVVEAQIQVHPMQKKKIERKKKDSNQFKQVC